MKTKVTANFCALVMASALVVGCASTDKQASKPLELNLAHINDHHSHLDEFSAAELSIAGERTQVALGGFARQVAAFKSVAKLPNLVKIHAGDAITGTQYFTLFQGKADAQMMNNICFDYVTLGNHEFDSGDAVLQSFLTYLRGGTCSQPSVVVSSNVQPAAGTPLAPIKDAHLVPWHVREIDGVRVGFIGITIVGKTVNASRPLPSTVFQPEVQAAQAAIDALKAQGVRHIVAVTHQGYENDKALAAQLTDLDVIIGGDSHSLLGDFSALGVPSSGPYPTVVRNKDGDKVCIGQAWEYSKAFGLMNVRFDAQGAVESCGGQAQLLIGDSFKRRDAKGLWVALPAAESAQLRTQVEAMPALRVLTPDAVALKVFKGYSDRVAEEKAKLIGKASESLCLVRIPGESTNRSASVAGCEQANVLARGSDAAQVVAEAFLHASKTSQIALQNSGGVRVAVPAGTLTMNSAYSVLPFANVLVELSMTGAELRATLEDAVSNYLENALSDGSHPYAAGLRWDLDSSKPRGQRFANLQVRDRNSGQWSSLDPQRTYAVVTNDFIASGKDGYTTMGKVFAAGRYTQTYLLYTQSLVDYIQVKGDLRRPARTEYSHQRVIARSGAALEE